MNEMAPGGRMQTRGRVLRRTLLVVGGLALLTLLFAATGHWILAVVTAVAAVAVGWVYAQARSVR
jgi:hypothetical protein